MIGFHSRLSSAGKYFTSSKSFGSIEVSNLQLGQGSLEEVRGFLLINQIIESSAKHP